ncbi:Nocturnin [Frankliniella fusca]|uniref:Nocturnin n=1 Tax=Frankliniella fusca TaxID=407009 RepID=A0AAE1LGC5_9NEOP|nr:Nocturnin [Frankliniella fusca]
MRQRAQQQQRDDQQDHHQQRQERPPDTAPDTAPAPASTSLLDHADLDSDADSLLLAAYLAADPGALRASARAGPPGPPGPAGPPGPKRHAMTDARTSTPARTGLGLGQGAAPHHAGHHAGLHHHSPVKSSEAVSAVSMLQNSMEVLQRMEDLHIGLQEDGDDDLEPSRVTALVAESLGVGDSEVSALMRESLAVAERLAAASLMTSAAAKRRLQARSIELGASAPDAGLGFGGFSGLAEEYVPPRALLLYLVR